MAIQYTGAAAQRSTIGSGPELQWKGVYIVMMRRIGLATDSYYKVVTQFRQQGEASKCFTGSEIFWVLDSPLGEPLLTPQLQMGSLYVPGDYHQPQNVIEEVVSSSHEALMGGFGQVSLPPEGMFNVTVSGPVDESWVSMQGFGQNDWMLRFASDEERR